MPAYIRPVGNSTPPRLTTHALFDLFFEHSTNSLFKPMTTAMERVASTAMLCPRLHHFDQHRCTDHKVWSASVHGSIHTHCIIVRQRWAIRYRTNQARFVQHDALHCAIVPSDNSGK